MTQTGATPPSPTSRFIGWLLIVVGGLMAVLCGGCTLVLWGVSLFAALAQPSASNLASVPLVLLVPAIIGGLPAAAGAVLVWAGWRVVHPRRPKKIDETFS